MVESDIRVASPPAEEAGRVPPPEWLPIRSR
jgi:hypothetical protein